MFIKAKRFVGQTLIAAFAVLAGQAVAGPIDGIVTFADGFATTATTTSIVSQLTVMNVNGTATASGCSGVFGSPCAASSTYALVFDITASNAQLVFDFNGFHFTATSFGSVNRGALTCDKSGNCGDALSFIATGDVTGTGYSSTPFDMLWSASATCTQNVINLPMLACGAGSISAGWTATVYAGSFAQQQRIAVPEPNMLALLGLGFLLLAFVARRRRR